MMVGVYFGQTSVIYFCLEFSSCLDYRGVHYSGVSARRELTVIPDYQMSERLSV